VNRLQRPHDRRQARAERCQAVVVQPQLGKARRRVFGLGHFGHTGRRSIEPSVPGAGVWLEAAEGVTVYRQRRDVVAEVELTQTQTVERERVDESQAVVTQIEIPQSPEVTQRFRRNRRQQIAL